MKDLMLTAEDIARILKRTKDYGYKVIRQLNKELADQGYFVNSGRVSAKYFSERTGIDLEDKDEQ